MKVLQIVSFVLSNVIFLFIKFHIEIKIKRKGVLPEDCCDWLGDCQTVDSLKS